MTMDLDPVGRDSGALAATETLGWLTGGPEDAPSITSRSAFIGRGEDGFCIEQPAAP